MGWIRFIQQSWKLNWRQLFFFVLAGGMLHKLLCFTVYIYNIYIMFFQIHVYMLKVIMGCSSLSGSGKAAIIVFLVYFCEDLFGMNIQKHHERPWSTGVSTTLLRTHLAGPWKQGLPMLAPCAAQRRSQVGFRSNRYGMIDHAWWKGSKELLHQVS